MRTCDLKMLLWFVSLVIILTPLGTKAADRVRKGFLDIGTAKISPVLRANLVASSVYQIVYQSKSADGRFYIYRALRACSSRLSLKYSCLNIRPFTRIFRQAVHLALICTKTEKTKSGKS